MPETPQCIGYIRCSTSEQEIARQVEGLRAHCDRLAVEYVSAGSKKRPVFEAVIAALQPGDTLVVWDFDRAFRSCKDAILTADSLQACGVHFRVIGLNIDTATDEGELFYTILAAFAQYERRIIARRTREGMEAARHKGKHIGRPRLLSAETARDAHEWIKETGYPYRYVAALLGVSRSTLRKALNNA